MAATRRAASPTVIAWLKVDLGRCGCRAQHRLPTAVANTGTRRAVRHKASTSTAAGQASRCGRCEHKRRQPGTRHAVLSGAGLRSSQLQGYFRHLIVGSPRQGQFIKLQAKVWQIVSYNENEGKSSKCKETWGKSSNSPIENPVPMDIMLGE